MGVFHVFKIVQMIPNLLKKVATQKKNNSCRARGDFIAIWGLKWKNENIT